jgi:hypothetical protein
MARINLLSESPFYSCVAGDDDSGPYEPRMIVILSAGARHIKIFVNPLMLLYTGTFTG